jgi:hypothetical protein
MLNTSPSPRPNEAWSYSARRYGSFALNWRTGRLVPAHP